MYCSDKLEGSRSTGTPSPHPSIMLMWNLANEIHLNFHLRTSLQIMFAMANCTNATDMLYSDNWHSTGIQSWCLFTNSVYLDKLVCVLNGLSQFRNAYQCNVGFIPYPLSFHSLFLGLPFCVAVVLNLFSIALTPNISRNNYKRNRWLKLDASSNQPGTVTCRFSEQETCICVPQYRMEQGNEPKDGLNKI